MPLFICDRIVDVANPINRLPLDFWLDFVCLSRFVVASGVSSKNKPQCVGIVCMILFIQIKIDSNCFCFKRDSRDATIRQIVH